MLAKGPRRLLVVFGCSLAFIAATIAFSGNLGRPTSSPSTYFPRVWTPTLSSNGGNYRQYFYGDSRKTAQDLDDVVTGLAVSKTHHVVYSNTTVDGKYFLVDFREYTGMNPNIIPHPTLPETWFVVAQQYKDSNVTSVWNTELVCEATFQDGTLKCNRAPLNLPITGTHSPVCLGDMEHFNMNIGPHDARVFKGPKAPYIIYGSQSALSCFGQWLQDFRRLVDWGGFPPIVEPFVHATDLERPPPYGALEKNWFVFWDTDGEAYVHHDVAPRRVFAKLHDNGSVSNDLAPLARPHDEVCWQKHLRSESPVYKSIHQATNSLSITLCKRHECSRKDADDKTFIMTIFQHKSYNNYHSAYEPYVMLFRPTAPFEMYAVSSKPIWIYGRGAEGEKRPKDHAHDTSWNETEMIYVTSMSWKSAERDYHGYMDDVLFLGFGIEDEGAGGLDVVAADLLQGLDIC